MKYLDSNDYEKAIFFFKKLVKDNSDDYRVYLNLSKAYHESNLFEEELQTILMYLSKYPDELRHFKMSLETLDSMGYFDFAQLEQ